MSLTRIIEDEAIEKITSSCKNLKMLNIQGLRGITHNSIISISKLKQLELLNISFCDGIKCEYLIYLKNCNIKVLCANMLKITDIDMNFVNYLDNINTLSIEGI